MKIAIVYDRVNKFGGAERVLLALHEIFPKAPLYTSVYSPKYAKWAKVFRKIKTSFLQNIPFAKTNHEFFAPLMPLAFSLFNFDDYDLVISVTSEFAKNITVKNGKHVCYCLTPTRYLWKFPPPSLLKPLIFFLKKIDYQAAQKPDIIVSISKEVQQRVKKYYHRDSIIIYPPASSYFKNSLLRGPHRNGSASRSFFENAHTQYWLLVSRLVKYKKVDLAIKAFNKLGLPLVIVGSGREEKKLKKIAKYNITFTGYVSDKQLAALYKNAKALIFPQEEDFGITAVEAQSYGIPVIAYKAGGALDTVINRKTGLFFEKQTVGSLTEAIKHFDEPIHRYKKTDCKKNAARFSKQKFQREILKLTSEVW